MSAVASSEIRDREWEVLLRSIERGKCVPLLGPELGVVNQINSTRCLTAELSQELAEILLEEQGIAVASPKNLSLCAQIFQNHLSRDTLMMETERFYQAHENQLGQCDDATFRHLASLPFPLYVTSRHDLSLEHYLRQVGKRPKVRAYEFKGDRTPTLGDLGTVEQPVVYRLYGSLDEPNSFVITENDLLDFLKAVVAGDPGLPVDLHNLFSEQNFLFLGFGLVDYHLRILFHVLNLSKSAKSFALENPPTSGDQSGFTERFNESVLFYNELGYNALKWIDSGFYDFVEELYRRWSARSPDDAPVASMAARQSVEEAATDGPSVFISYVKENEEFAGQLFARLRDEGLCPWIDSEGLRFGARWNDTLEDAITKEVDYFVVLQSHALSERDESYVHKEVKLALERQDLRAGRFIFPVQIDPDAVILDALDRAKIQSGQLYDLDESVALLAKEIKREEQRRRRR